MGEDMVESHTHPLRTTHRSRILGAGLEIISQLLVLIAEAEDALCRAMDPTAQPFPNASSYRPP
jgi:hypothetical protein